MLTDTNVRARPDTWPIANHVLELEASIIREILKVSSQPGVISFAGGLPAPESFPVEDVKRIAGEVLDKYGHNSLQYSLSQGIVPLREIIAQRATSKGSASGPENILITSGSQQAIELVARAFVEPGDYILTESPTYLGALQAFNYYQARYVTVRMDDEGMIVDEVRQRIEEYQPKLIYTVATFQNPTGITMSEERRRRLVELAAEFNLPIVNDNPYGDIRFAGTPVPSLKSIGGDGIVTLRTFSKNIAPGLRVGWMNGPASIIAVCEKVRQCTDLHTNTFCQYLAYEFLKQGLMESHLEEIKKIYAEKRNAMLSRMEQKFPAGVKWTRPEGGLFLWVELPSGMSAKDLFPMAIERKVAYVYGEPFFPNGGGENTLRLNYATADTDEITEGIDRLAALIQENM
ncbi:MAG: PLP-dependent aminotransferase family protein [Candidatus Zixiibacteriota bacterium]|nr:MAG: PLP-dependent aminotransferase family protein [candidate division Zixibacteria bacterium]